MFSNLVATPLELVGKLTDHITDLAGRNMLGNNDSLIQVSQAARVEPIVLVDQRAKSLPYITDVMQSMSSIFTGYYLQAVAMSCQVGRVNVIKLLDRLSPTRGGVMDQLSAAFAKPSTESLKLPDFSVEGFGLEASVNASKTLKGEDIVADKEGAVDKFKAGANKDLSAVVNEASNLSVGKLVEITVTDQGISATFPVTVRLLANTLDPQTLVHILSDNGRNNSFMERIHGWLSGEKKFWKDLILCQDLIDEHRKAMMKDQTSVYADILARRRGNAKAALVTGQPSAATASNLVVLTLDSAKELERQIGGRLKDFHVRQRVFENTYLMIMAVVDPEWEHVTFYHRGISTATQLSLAELKNSNKGTGPDVMEILKAFQLGSSPSF